MRKINGRNLISARTLPFWAAVNLAVIAAVPYFLSFYTTITADQVFSIISSLATASSIVWVASSLTISSTTLKLQQIALKSTRSDIDKQLAYLAAQVQQGTITILTSASRELFNLMKKTLQEISAASGYVGGNQSLANDEKFVAHLENAATNLSFIACAAPIERFCAQYDYLTDLAVKFSMNVSITSLHADGAEMKQTYNICKGLLARYKARIT